MLLGDQESDDPDLPEMEEEEGIFLNSLVMNILQSVTASLNFHSEKYSSFAQTLSGEGVNEGNELQYFLPPRRNTSNLGESIKQVRRSFRVRQEEGYMGDM